MICLSLLRGYLLVFFKKKKHLLKLEPKFEQFLLLLKYTLRFCRCKCMYVCTFLCMCCIYLCLCVNMYLCKKFQLFLHSNLLSDA